MINVLYINTPTLEDYEEVVQYFLDKGILWMSGDECIFRDYWHVGFCLEIRWNHMVCSTWKPNALTMDDFHAKYTNRHIIKILKGFR